MDEIMTAMKKGSRKERKSWQRLQQDEGNSEGRNE